MIKEYDLALMRQKCGELKEAANSLCGHDIPEWMEHRLAHIIDEAASLESILDDETSSGHGRD